MEAKTLTLHHILPYLPFGLMVEVTSVDGIDIEPFTAMQIVDGYEIAQISNTDYYFGDENEFSIKPLLYSLDDYKNAYATKILPEPYKQIVWELSNGLLGRTIDTMPYAAIQAMAEAHIDIFRLIDAGLAVRKEPLK